MGKRLIWVLAPIFIGVLSLTLFLLFKYFSFPLKTEKTVTTDAIDTVNERETGPGKFLRLDNQIAGYSLGVNNTKALEELLVDWETNITGGANFRGKVATVNIVTLSLFDKPLISVLNNEDEELEYYNISWKNPTSGQTESVSQAHIVANDYGNLKVEMYVNPDWLKSPVDIFTGGIRQGSALSGNNLVNYLINYQLLNILFESSIKEVNISIEKGKLKEPYWGVEISKKIESQNGNYIVELTKK